MGLSIFENKFNENPENKYRPERAPTPNQIEKNTERKKNKPLMQSTKPTKLPNNGPNQRYLQPHQPLLPQSLRREVLQNSCEYCGHLP
jgi:hypothetical protein